MSLNRPDPNQPKAIPGFPDYAIYRDGTVVRITASQLNGRQSLPPSQWRELRQFEQSRQFCNATRRLYRSRFVMLCRPGAKRGLKRSVGKLLHETWGGEAKAEWLANQPQP